MTQDYSEQDTERVRSAQLSSEGLQTQPLDPSVTLSQTLPATASRSQGANAIAMVLIGVGVLMLLGRFAPQQGDITGGLVLLTIASCFLFFSFWRRIYGLLIPGSILAGLALGVPFASMTNGVSVLWGLALGFLAILFTGKVLFGVKSHWPIYPAIPLFAVGTIVAISSVPWIFAGGLIWLPLLLIAVGLYLGWGRRV